MDNRKEEFAEFIVFMRKAVGWTTQTLSEKTGTPFSTIRKYERARNYPSSPQFEARLREEVKKEIRARRAERKKLEVVPVKKPMREVWVFIWDKEKATWELEDGMAPYPKPRDFSRTGVPERPRTFGPVYDPGIEDVAWQPELLQSMEGAAVGW